MGAFTQSSAPEDGRDHRPKRVELIGIINKPLLLHLAGVYIIYKRRYLYINWRMSGPGRKVVSGMRMEQSA